MAEGSVFDCALRVLALRDHAEAELKRKLKTKGYQAREIEESLVRLRELGYLDDARFARYYAESALRNGRGYGSRLKLELARRGVAEEIIRQTLSLLSEDYGEAELLEQIMARRFAGFQAESATDKEKRRIVSYLQRKGFSLAAILARLKLHSIF